MFSVEEKQIAKEIVITMLQKDVILRTEYPKAKTVSDIVCDIYKQVLATVATPENK